MKGGAKIVSRVRQVHRGLRSRGPHWLAERVRHALAERIRPKTPLPQVLTADVLAVDLTAPQKVRALPFDPSTRMSVNWIIQPASPGSGGHTTIFRILRHLEANGFSNRVYFYDPYGADHDYYAAIVREHYGFNGPIEPIAKGLEDAHAVIATSWPTAYPVFASRSAGLKFYFVQDFEPDFYAASSDRVLAENTYRMGLHAITAGGWLALMLRRDYGMEADHFDFGCDAGQYRLENLRDQRKGIAFYARPGASRRAFELGVMTLELLAKRRPDFDLHLYGSHIGRLPFRFIDHGLVSPSQLNVIYNSCFAGLTLSLTNVSLVPHEMLAAGCIPVVNDAEHNRMVLDNPYVRYAPLAPYALASALEEVADTPDPAALSRAASESVRARNWEDAGRQVADTLRRSCGGISLEQHQQEKLKAWLRAAS